MAGKNLKTAYEKFNKEQIFTAEEAIKLLKEHSFEKFDASIDLSINMNLDTTLADQQFRGTIVLPHGTGKTAKVLVVAEPDDQTAAKAAGADHTGGIEVMEKVKNENWFDFDFIVTTPTMMPGFAMYGKILGPKGLMPNPKLGTVTTDIVKAVENIKKGQVEYRTDKEGIINMIIGKKSFDNNKILENFEAIYTLISGKKPSSIKGDFIKSVTISTTMGPGVKVEIK